MLDLAVWIGLIASCLVVYAQVTDFDFVDYDDAQTVYENSHVHAGLSPAVFRWAMSAEVANNWIPVTVLSHVVDSELFGMQSGLHHAVNVVFHVLAAGLLFMALHRATGARAQSAFVAFMFALHPLNVGSVAWVSERKGILGAFFWFLALYAYVWYTEHPSRARYYLVVAAPFCLGLLSKPMLITFPFTLLLFDLWPLRRFEWPRAIWEKLPLFALSAVAVVVTYIVQSATGAVVQIPFQIRAANAVITYTGYIRQLVWPVNLAVFYPYANLIPIVKLAVAAVALAAVTTLAILVRKSRPYAAMGWFWYLGTLVPVIGLIQVGMQAHADRYMYIPMVGLWIMLAWGAGDLVRRWPSLKPVMAACAVMLGGVYMLLSWRETGWWRNTQTLFQHALDVTQDNWVAENNLGISLAKAGLRADAIPHFQAALRMQPGDAEAQNNLGGALLALEDCAAAVPHFEAALRLRPGFASPTYNLGGCQMVSGNYAAAMPYFQAAIREEPDFGDAHLNLAICFSKIPGRAQDAVREYEAGLMLTPGDAKAHLRLAELLEMMGRNQEALRHLEVAQRIEPNAELTKKILLLRSTHN